MLIKEVTGQKPVTSFWFFKGRENHENCFMFEHC